MLQKELEEGNVQHAPRPALLQKQARRIVDLDKASRLPSPTCAALCMAFFSDGATVGTKLGSILHKSASTPTACKMG